MSRAQSLADNRLFQLTLDAFDAANLGREAIEQMRAVLEAIIKTSSESSTPHILAKAVIELFDDRLDLMKSVCAEFDAQLVELRGAA